MEKKYYIRGYILNPAPGNWVRIPEKFVKSNIVSGYEELDALFRKLNVRYLATLDLIKK